MGKNHPFPAGPMLLRAGEAEVFTGSRHRVEVRLLRERITTYKHFGSANLTLEIYALN